VAVDLARHEWTAGYRRLEDERENGARYRQLLAHVEAVSDELRRRIGSVITISELAAEYRRADDWVPEVLAELPPEAQYPAGVSLATDAAFYFYARGARDYEP
jgi:predicted amidohydrolase YtcJ